MLVVEADISHEIARALIRRHGPGAGRYAIVRLCQLLENGDEAELATWLGVMAELVALLAEKE